MDEQREIAVRIARASEVALECLEWGPLSDYAIEDDPDSAVVLCLKAYRAASLGVPPWLYHDAVIYHDNIAPGDMARRRIAEVLPTENWVNYGQVIPRKARNKNE